MIANFDEFVQLLGMIDRNPSIDLYSMKRKTLEEL